MEYIAVSIAFAGLVYMLHRQQRTIDQLTNKLMSRDYREYVSMQYKPETEPPKQRKALSYYDDPSIDPEYGLEDT